MAKQFNSIEEVKEWLQTLPMNILIDTAAIAIYNNSKAPEKIIITKEQFQKFFRIKGFTSDGEVERRGRKE